MAISISRCTVRGNRTEDNKGLQETWHVVIDEGDDPDIIDPYKIYTNEGSVFNALPQMGEKYDHSNVMGVTDIDVGDLESASGKRRRVVTISYAEIPPILGHNGVPIGETSNDPRTWDPRVSVDGTLVSHIATRARFLGYFAHADQDTDPCATTVYPGSGDLEDVSNSFASLTKGNIEPIRNTAGYNIEGGIDVGRVEHRVQITKYSTLYNVNAVECFQNRLNDDAIDLSIAARNFTMSVAANELWLQRIRGIERYTEFNELATGNRINLRYYEVVYDMLYRKGGFVTDIANVGTRRGVDGGDPDGTGGLYSPTDIKAGMIAGVATRGPDGFTDEEPKFIDKTGRAYLTGNNASYLRYLEHLEADFSDVNLGLVGNGVGP